MGRVGESVYLSSGQHRSASGAGSPESREVAHERSGWGEMVYLYRTGSRNYAYEMEKRLIAHCQSHRYSANAIGGGGGLRQYDLYYVYVLLE